MRLLWDKMCLVERPASRYIMTNHRQSLWYWHNGNSRRAGHGTTCWIPNNQGGNHELQRPPLASWTVVMCHSPSQCSVTSPLSAPLTQKLSNVAFPCHFSHAWDGPFPKCDQSASAPPSCIRHLLYFTVSFTISCFGNQVKAVVCKVVTLELQVSVGEISTCPDVATST